MKTEVEFLQDLVKVIESDRPTVAILNIVETKLSNRLDRLMGGLDEEAPPVSNRQVEGRDDA